MDGPNTAQGCVAILAITAALFSPAFATQLYFYGGDFDLPIPAEPNSSKGPMDDAVIFVPHHITIADLDVFLDIAHPNVFDLQIFLQSPAGPKLCLNRYRVDEFFKGANYEHTIFDDDALTPIEMAEPPFRGRFKPRPGNFLNAFNGRDAYGQWHLQIYDRWHNDTGRLNSAGLIITGIIPEPATAALLTLGIALLRLGPPRSFSSRLFSTQNSKPKMLCRKHTIIVILNGAKRSEESLVR